MSRLHVESLAVDYEAVRVIEDLSFTVEPGEFISLLGPSGCGKTTTLNAIAGFVPARQGSIRIGEQDVTRMKPHRRGLGMVFQSYALFPHLTVEGNIAYGLQARRVPGQERVQRVREIAELVGLSGFLERYPAHLSGGQQQRVALARALVIEPGVLLMDEPLSNLDMKLRVEIRDEIRRLQQNLGQTALLVTHDQDEAMAMSDRIIVLNQGRIEQIGTPEDLYNAPQTRFVAGFMGFANVIGSDLARTVLENWRPGSNGSGEEAPFVAFRPSAATGLGTPGSAPSDGEVTVEGVVLSSSFIGARVRYRLRCAADVEFIVDVPASAARLGVGESARVRIARRGVVGLAE